ncbi:carbohydrate kinase family protein [Lutibaculum baratangense]|uniref:Ribokinase n=1 Tax=Lutibaculum baratangense AMV1 TaxID=631454 RepID=V4TCI2_9HYPH|nr:carbohydrate kinase family protein [Lutibaculum baratangense]ESR24018.1 Ribokinase [Lutibaculum baratangense AMV1]
MRAATVGSATVDIITVVANHDIERVTMSNAFASFLLLEQGRKIEAESIQIHPGGGAVNAGVCLRRLGYEVAPVVKIGRDPNANVIREVLAAHGIDGRNVVVTDKAATGITVMIASHDRNATAFTFRGANTLIEDEDVAAKKFEGLDLVHVSGLSNRSADQFPAVVERAKAGGAFVSANPGIRQLTSRRESFLASLAGIDLLNLNRVEAESLVPALANGGKKPRSPQADWPALARRGLVTPGFDMGLAEYCDALHERGVRNVAVTDGTEGAYLSVEGRLYHMPTVPVVPAGTAGAGDAFVATLGARLAAGADAEDAIADAAVNAASVVERTDTLSGLMEAGALERRRAGLPPDLHARRLA